MSVSSSASCTYWSPGKLWEAELTGAETCPGIQSRFVPAEQMLRHFPAVLAAGPQLPPMLPVFPSGGD